MRIKIFLMAAAVAFLAGCDTFYGVSRYVAVSEIPSRDLVERSLRSVPEINSVDYSELDPGSAYAYQIGYASGSARGQIGSGSAQDKTKFFEISCWWINHVPAAQELRATRSLMDKVYAALRDRCPKLPPAAELYETTRGLRE
ncbi:MAG: hypothetical protein M3O30_16215 [Planctomycetota bacterium]|nr:hypothetical protein [Planctomycetota bacterium]